jgi:hypothetical protein
LEAGLAAPALAAVLVLLSSLPLLPHALSTSAQTSAKSADRIAVRRHFARRPWSWLDIDRLLLLG